MAIRISIVEPARRAAAADPRGAVGDIPQPRGSRGCERVIRLLGDGSSERHARLAAGQLAFLRFFDWPDSDIAMATACLQLFAFLPEPLLSVPCLCSLITLVNLAFLP